MAVLHTVVFTLPSLTSSEIICAADRSSALITFRNANR